jgi:hypothetical protein
MHFQVYKVAHGAVHVHHDPHVPHVHVHIEKFKKVMRHIKLISMNMRLSWMHLEAIL